jgi:glycosyltransferase involved in cell wall biosynthesis
MSYIYIDITGLSYKHQSGVQNTLWGLVNGTESLNDLEKNKILFYDCSGKLNSSINSRFHDNYINELYSTNKNGSILIKKLYDYGLLKLKFRPSDESINHVWNWGIKELNGARNSITMYDILPLQFPEYFSKKMINLTETSIEFALNKCSQIQCISKYTKSLLVNNYAFREENIKVVYPSISHLYFEEKSNIEETKNFLNQFSLKNSEYFISIGYLDPRKNLVNQIKAFKLFTERSGNKIKYALTGFPGSYTKEILTLINHPSLQGKVVFLGFLEMEILKIAIENSAGLLYCSKAEGFGIPIIEGYACRTNVVTSNTTSMVEIGQGRAYLADPDNIEDIAEGISRAYSIKNSALILNNYEYSQKFTDHNWVKGHFFSNDYELPK